MTEISNNKLIQLAFEICDERIVVCVNADDTPAEAKHYNVHLFSWLVFVWKLFGI